MDTSTETESPIWFITRCVVLEYVIDDHYNTAIKMVGGQLLALHIQKIY